MSEFEKAFGAMHGLAHIEIEPAKRADKSKFSRTFDEEKDLKTQCPRCNQWISDSDWLGFLEHCFDLPYRPKACGYCSHPVVRDYTCGVCGAKEGSDKWFERMKS